MVGGVLALFSLFLPLRIGVDIRLWRKRFFILWRINTPQNAIRNTQSPAVIGFVRFCGGVAAKK